MLAYQQHQSWQLTYAAGVQTLNSLEKSISFYSRTFIRLIHFLHSFEKHLCTKVYNIVLQTQSKSFNY